MKPSDILEQYLSDTLVLGFHQEMPKLRHFAGNQLFM